MNDIEILRAYLDISTLKARQLRLLDTKQWVGYEAMLTEDFVFDLSESGQTPVIHGRAAALEQIKASCEGLTSVHQAHQPEFDFRGNEVLVVWAMNDRVVRGPDQPSITLYGHHHDRWVRRSGEWKMAALRVTSVHVDVLPPAGAAAMG